MNSCPKSVGKKIFIGAICICVLVLIFGIGHHYGCLDEAKGNATFNAKVLTDIYDHLESNDLEKAKSKLRFLIYGNVMIHDLIFRLPIATNSVSVRLWTHAREIAREEATNVVPFSEQSVINQVNDFIKTNKTTNTNAMKNP